MSSWRSRISAAATRSSADRAWAALSIRFWLSLRRSSATEFVFDGQLLLGFIRLALLGPKRIKFLVALLDRLKRGRGLGRRPRRLRERSGSAAPRQCCRDHNAAGGSTPGWNAVMKGRNHSGRHPGARPMSRHISATAIVGSGRTFQNWLPVFRSKKDAPGLKRTPPAKASRNKPLSRRFMSELGRHHACGARIVMNFRPAGGNLGQRRSLGPVRHVIRDDTDARPEWSAPGRSAPAA